MSFSSTPFWRLLLVIDLGVLAAALALARLVAPRFKWGPGPGALFGMALAVALWSAAGLWWVGGIIGIGLAARACWTAATVALPVLFARAAWRESRLLLLMPAAALVGFKWFGERWEPAALEVTRARIPVAGLRGPVRVAHFSDLQTDGLGPAAFAARDAANGFDADFVTFSGDVANHPAVVPEALHYLAGFKARRAKLFVGGDVDRDLDRARFEKETGFAWIDGRAPIFDAGGSRVAFLGFGLLDYRLGGSHAERLAAGARGATVKLALAHRPDTAFALAGLGVAALLTGHTHGGQVVLPGWGPILTLTRMPDEVAAGGVSTFRGMTVILSRGIGWEGHVAPRVRLFCKPQVILAELVPASR